MTKVSRARWWSALAAVAAVGVLSCKSATHLSVGGVEAGPILIHAPMGIGGVRFTSESTGREYVEESVFREQSEGGSYQQGSNTVYVSAYKAEGIKSTKGMASIRDNYWVSNAHVDLGRWLAYAVVLAVGRGYAEAEGDIVRVNVSSATSPEVANSDVVDVSQQGGPQ